MLWNQDYSCPTIVLLRENVLLLLGLQINDGIFKKWPPTDQPTNKAGSWDAIASKKNIFHVIIAAKDRHDFQINDQAM